MFIVWGRKAKRKKIGYVADFCPACGEPRAFMLQRVSMVNHVYYIPFGDGPTVGHERMCLGCKSRYRAEPLRYAAIRHSNCAFESLRDYTFPNLDAFYANQIDLQHKLKHDPALLSADERKAVIVQSVGAMSARVEERFARTHIDAWVGMALLATIAALFGGGYLGGLFPEYQATIFGAAFCAGIFAVIAAAATSGRRYMKHKVVPHVVQALEPLHPSETEIADVLASFKSQGLKIGRKLKSSDLILATMTTTEST